MIVTKILTENDIFEKDKYYESTFDYHFSFFLTDNQKNELAEKQKEILQNKGFEVLHIFVYDSYFIIKMIYRGIPILKEGADNQIMIAPLLLGGLIVLICGVTIIAGLLITHKITKELSGDLPEITKNIDIGLFIILLIIIVVAYLYMKK